MSCRTLASSTGLAWPWTARTCGWRIDSPLPRRQAAAGLHHLIYDGQGIPLAVRLTAGNRNDITELPSLVDRVPPTGRYGKFRPKTLLADRAYPTAPTTVASPPGTQRARDHAQDR
jgi:hypothetical protein